MNSRFLPFLTVLLTLTAAPLHATPLDPKIIYVAENRGGTGNTWNSAYAYLQQALDRACVGDEIRIAQGTYIPGEKPGVSATRTSTFQLISGVTIRGGYQLGGTVSNPDLYPTILSGEIGGGSISDNCYHVVTGTNSFGTATVLENVTITRGNANGSAAARDHLGGGFICDGSGTPFLNNVIITGNSAQVGGGAYLNTSGPTFTECTISNNTTPINGAGPIGEGAGMYLNLTNADFFDCTFTGNVAADPGGALSNHNSSPDISGCTFENNSAGYRGGAIYNIDSYDPAPLGNEIIGCTFIGNSTTTEGATGGAISNLRSSPPITGCHFEQNNISGRTFRYGGAIANKDSQPDLLDCSFSNNGDISDVIGGAIHNDSSPPSIKNCSFDHNKAEEGGAIYSRNSPSIVRVIRNCTFHKNEVIDNGSAVYHSNSQIYYQSCTFEGNKTDGGSIFGGTIYASGPDSPTFNNCVIWNVGELHFLPNLQFRYCLVEGESAATLNSSGTGSHSNLNGTNPADDPLLARFGDYGGPTKTMPPLPGSPIINPSGGLMSSSPIDQRGLPRLVGPTNDVGAVEIQGAADHFNITFYFDRDGDGYCDGLEAAIGSNPLVPDRNHPNRLRLVGSATSSYSPFLLFETVRADLNVTLSTSTGLSSFQPWHTNLPAKFHAFDKLIPPGGSEFFRLEVTPPPFP